MNLAQHALAAAVCGPILDRVNEAKAEHRAAVAAGLAEMYADSGGDRIAVKLPDGTKVASAALSPAKDRVEITDPAAFLTWVLENHPEQLSVSYAFRNGYLNRLIVQDDGTCFDPTNGEPVPFAGFVKAADTTPSLRINYTRDGKELIAAAWAAGQLAEVVAGLGSAPALPAVEPAGAGA